MGSRKAGTKSRRKLGDPLDTSAIIDARDPDSPWHNWAKERIAEAVAGEGAAVNPFVLSEATVRAKDTEGVRGALENYGMIMIPLPISVSVPAAKAFAIYLERLKKEWKPSANRMPLPDFLIGAHAQAEGLKLATRDPDRVRKYFPKVVLIVP